MLFEELASKFGCQTVEPFKEPVLIIDAKEFKPQWEEQLKAEGCRILASDYLGRACFFVRKPQPSNSSMGSNPSLMEQKQIEEPKPKLQPSNIEQKEQIEEQIARLIKEGCGFNQIKERLGLTHAQLMGHLSSMRRKGVLAKLGWTSTRQRKLSALKQGDKLPSLPNDYNGEKGKASDLNVKELLLASLKLIEEHPKIVKILLEKAEQML